MKSNESVYKLALAVWSRLVAEEWSRNVRKSSRNGVEMVPKSSPGPLRRGKRASQRLRENTPDLPRAPNMVPKAFEGGPRSLWGDLRDPFGSILAPIPASGTSFGSHFGSYSDILDAFPPHFSANTNRRGKSSNLTAQARDKRETFTTETPSEQHVRKASTQQETFRKRL